METTRVVMHTALGLRAAGRQAAVATTRRRRSGGGGGACSRRHLLLARLVLFLGVLLFALVVLVLRIVIFGRYLRHGSDVEWSKSRGGVQRRVELWSSSCGVNCRCGRLNRFRCRSALVLAGLLSVYLLVTG